MSKPGPNSPHLVNVIFPTRDARSKFRRYAWFFVTRGSSGDDVRVTDIPITTQIPRMTRNGKNDSEWSWVSYSCVPFVLENYALSTSIKNGL